MAGPHARGTAVIPSGLLRVKIQKRALQPSFVQPDKPAIVTTATEVVERFAQAATEERTLGELMADIDEWCADRRDHRMVRGLVHLVRQRTTLLEVPEVDPIDLRRKAFSLAAERGPLALTPGPLDRPTADHILGEIGEPLGLSVEETRTALFSDLESQRPILGSAVTDPAWLIHRYNVALVQGVLQRATGVTLTLREASGPRLKQLFRYVKFYQLLFRAEAEPKTRTLTVRLDGPMSLFRASTRYGRQLAQFFPALLMQDGPWSLHAEVLWTKARHRKTLDLTHEAGLVSHYRDTGAYHTKSQLHFVKQFATTDTDWTLREGAEPITLGPKTVLFPDFTCEDGARSVHLEVWGHWRREALDQRLDMLDSHGRRDWLLLVSKKLCGSKGSDLPEHPQLLTFSEVISPRKVLARVEQLVPSER
ncbi:MAG: DUF790 family protein [Myxococcota bacterium]